MAKTLPDPNQAATKWADHTGAASQAYTNGINNVQQAPGQAAAAASDLWLRRTQASADKYKRRVASVDIGTWKQAATQKGAPRLADGARQAQPKMAAFNAKFYPHLAAGVQAVRAMPKGGVDAGIARATAMIRHNANFKG